MKSKLLLICASLYVINAHAQKNEVTIDLATKTMTPMEVKLAGTTTVKFTNCDLIKPGTKIKIGYFGIGSMQNHEADCSAGDPVIFQNILGGGASFDINITGEKQAGGAFDFTIKVNADGKMIPAAAEQKPGADDAYAFNFVNPAFLNPVYPDDSCKDCNNCRIPLIVYNPCCNSSKRYEVFDKSGKVNHLRYYSDIRKNRGVVFLIKNFNTLGYEVSVNNEYSNPNTEMPELFGTVIKYVQAGLSLANSGGAAEKKGKPLFLQKLLKLNAGLAPFLNAKLKDAGCSTLDDFDVQKAAIINNIRTEFGITSARIDLVSQYNEAKAKYIALIGNGYTDKKFNEDFADKNDDPKKTVTPDDLVKGLQEMLVLLITTRFEYQYNVPQLQNADKIIFNVSITKKDAGNGPIHMSNEPITIPIRGGWKFDFSTGFYYSSKRNETYSLRDIRAANDSLTGKWIVPEDSVQSGKGAIGVNALMHIYPRLGKVQPAFTLGVGASAQLNYSLLAGLGLILGEDNRFIISGGFNFSNVKVLSDKYYQNGVRVVQSKDLTSVDTYNKVKTGLFLSVSYSLGLVKKNQTPATEKAKK